MPVTVYYSSSVFRLSYFTRLHGAILSVCMPRFANVLKYVSPAVSSIALEGSVENEQKARNRYTHSIKN